MRLSACPATRSTLAHRPMAGRSMASSFSIPSAAIGTAISVIMRRAISAHRRAAASYTARKIAARRGKISARSWSATHRCSTRMVHTPDVSVVFANGRYHMVYDWGQVNFNADGGLAYAWADKPEGPWHRATQPITLNSTLTHLLGRYQRTYAATLVRRKNDWMIVAMLDNAPYSWALFAMTAPEPQGPYSERKLVRNVEAGYFHPPLMEFYPAFADGDWVYATATSVARNRNFQIMFRAPLERAMDPKAWEIFRHGSVWHSEDVPNEAYGIWGQTFSGCGRSETGLVGAFPVAQ